MYQGKKTTSDSKELKGEAAAKSNRPEKWVMGALKKPSGGVRDKRCMGEGKEQQAM